MNKIPSWLHKPANINPEVLPKIQDELIQLFNETKTSYLYTDKTMGFSTQNLFNKVELLKKLPTLARELSRLKIIKYFDTLCLFWLRPGFTELPIHIDDPEFNVNIALNIPVQGCRGSYTVWYDAEIDFDANIPDYATDGVYDPGGRTVKDGAREIERIDSGTPAWVNISVPHQGLYVQGQERINASIRFTTEIYDIIDSNFFNEQLVLRE
jgi:hypothetical protein